MEMLTTFIELTKKICSLNAYYDNKSVVAMYVNMEHDIDKKILLKIATAIIKSILFLEDHDELVILRDLHQPEFDEVARILNDINVLRIFYAYSKGHLGILDLRDKLFINGVRFF